MLQLLDNPKYVQLLVNPNNKCVAIKGITTKTPGDQAQRIRPKSFTEEHDYELYSMSFVHKLFDIVGNLERNRTYRLRGTIVKSHCMAIFSLETLTPIEM